MSTIAILFVITSSLFGGPNAREMLRFDSKAACESAATTFQKAAPKVNLICIDHIVLRP